MSNRSVIPLRNIVSKKIGDDVISQIVGFKENGSSPTQSDTPFEPRRKLPKIFEVIATAQVTPSPPLRKREGKIWACPSACVGRSKSVFKDALVPK